MKFDGDSALLLFFIAVGLIPVAGDLVEGRRVGGMTTLAMLVVALAASSLVRRAAVLYRARNIRRQLLTQERGV